MAQVRKIDSNVTGLRIAEETSIATLPSPADFSDLEPNTYTDYGGNLTLVARNPINAGRQRKKGVITDLDATGGFNQDLTFTNFHRLWPGVFMSTRLELPVFDDAITVDDANDEIEGYNIESLFPIGSLVLLSGFDTSANNGLTVVDAHDYDAIEVAKNLAADTAPSSAKVELVGIQLGTSELNVVAATGSSGPRLSRVSGSIDFTQFPQLRFGAFIFIGGDDAAARFTGAFNNGFARIRSVGADYIELDKTGGGADGVTEMGAETGTGKTIQIFLCESIKNVSALDADFALRSYTIERSLGRPNPQSAPTQIQSELLKGSVLNTIAINITQADKITFDATFIATDNEQRNGLNPGMNGGDERLLSTLAPNTVTPFTQAGAYNTSSDFSRIKLSAVPQFSDAAPSPLFAFVTEITLNVNNNATPNKAVAVLGAFDVSVGTFEVGGSITAYFADVAAVNAVRQNSDITFDIAIVKDFRDNGQSRKAGLVFDVPLIALGNGRLNVVQDQAITLPLQTEAAEGEAEAGATNGHTLMLCEFPYLPNTADL